MSFLLLEPGSSLLLEPGSHLLLDACPPPIGPALLLEPGSYLLLDGCDHLLLAYVEPPPPPPPSTSSQGYANRRRPLGIINEAMEEEDLELILAIWMGLK